MKLIYQWVYHCRFFKGLWFLPLLIALTVEICLAKTSQKSGDASSLTSDQPANPKDDGSQENNIDHRQEIQSKSQLKRQRAKEISPQLNLLLSQQVWNLQWDASWSQPLFYEPRQSLWNQGIQSNSIRASYMGFPWVNVFLTTGLSHSPEENGYLLEGLSITINRKKPFSLGRESLLILGTNFNVPSNTRRNQTGLLAAFGVHTVFIGPSWHGVTPILNYNLSYLWHEWQTLPWGSPSPVWRLSTTASVNYALSQAILLTFGIGYRASWLYSNRWEDQISHFQQINWQVNPKLSLYASHSWSTPDMIVWGTNGNLRWEWISPQASQISIGTLWILK